MSDDYPHTIPLSHQTIGGTHSHTDSSSSLRLDAESRLAYHQLRALQHQPHQHHHDHLLAGHHSSNSHDFTSHQRPGGGGPIRRMKSNGPQIPPNFPLDEIDDLMPPLHTYAARYAYIHDTNEEDEELEDHPNHTDSDADSLIEPSPSSPAAAASGPNHDRKRRRPYELDSTTDGQHQEEETDLMITEQPTPSISPNGIDVVASASSSHQQLSITAAAAAASSRPLDHRNSAVADPDKIASLLIAAESDATHRTTHPTLTPTSSDTHSQLFQPTTPSSLHPFEPSSTNDRNMIDDDSNRSDYHEYEPTTKRMKFSGSNLDFSPSQSDGTNYSQPHLSSPNPLTKLYPILPPTLTLAPSSSCAWASVLMGPTTHLNSSSPPVAATTVATATSTASDLSTTMAAIAVMPKLNSLDSAIVPAVAITRVSATPTTVIAPDQPCQVKTIKPRIKTRPCKVVGCTQVTETDRTRFDHLVQAHAIYLCVNCETEFPSEDEWRSHLPTHRAANTAHMCDFCGKGFNCPRDFSRHILTHSGEKPFECDQCHTRFTREGALAVHKKTHAEIKEFLCTHPNCGKSFTQNSVLKSHMRIHTGEKPFKCDVCSNSYSQKAQLVTHQRVHSGDKPYVCQFCSHRFITSSNLITHQRTHTGNGRIHACTFPGCEKKFTRKATLTHHQQSHAGAAASNAISPLQYVTTSTTADSNHPMGLTHTESMPPEDQLFQGEDDPSTNQHPRPIDHPLNHQQPSVDEDRSNESDGGGVEEDAKSKAVKDAFSRVESMLNLSAASAHHPPAHTHPYDTITMF